MRDRAITEMVVCQVQIYHEPINEVPFYIFSATLLFPNSLSSSVMGVRSQLESLVISILLVPYATILFFVIIPILQFCMPLNYFNLLPDFQFIDQNLITFDYDTILGVSQFKKGIEDKVRCIFCLCDVDEGEQIRELPCLHLFHRSCLDTWLEFSKATCPLCRVPLVPSGENTEIIEVNDGELWDSHLAPVSNIHKGWWIW